MLLFVIVVGVYFSKKQGTKIVPKPIMRAQNIKKVIFLAHIKKK